MGKSRLLVPWEIRERVVKGEESRDGNQLLTEPW
jgi:hypothetical protein